MVDETKQSFIVIQILRAFAALMVVGFHSSLAIAAFHNAYWRDGDDAFRVAHFAPWANHLSAGVDIFFCISGFIMCLLASKATAGDSLKFLSDRFVRILPPYWFFTGIILVLYVCAPQWHIEGLTGDLGQDGPRFVTSLLLLPQSGNPILGPGWTLIHELLFYYLVTLVIRLGYGSRLVRVLAVAALVGIVLCALGIKLLHGYGLSVYYVEFFAGALIYRVYKTTSAFFPGVQCALAVALYFATSALLDHHQEPPVHALVQVFGFGLMGVLLISGGLGLDRTFKAGAYAVPRWLARVGDASYTLYLSHWFVLAAFGKVAGLWKDAPVPVVIIWQVLAISAAVCFAQVFAAHVELPGHRKLAQYLATRRAKPVVALSAR